MVVLFYIASCLQLFFLEGGGLEYSLHSRAEKCFNHQMLQGKNLFHTNSVFLQSQQYMHYEYKIFNSSFDTVVCFV